MKIKGAIFDMDGTLVNSLMFWDSFFEQLGRKYLEISGFKPEPEVDRAVRTMILSEAVIYINRACNLGASDDEIVEYSTNMLKDFYSTEASVKDGVIELLEALSRDGVKLAVASATDKKYVNIALRCLGLEKFFDKITSCSEIGFGKDRPDVYYAALDLLGLSIDEVAVFEDAPLALKTAKSAGFFTVGVFDKYNSDQKSVKSYSDIYITEKENLASLIEKI